MNDTQPYSEVRIEIHSCEFEKAGSITFVGTVEGQEFVITWDATMKVFEQILPQAEVDFEYKDFDDLCNAVLDDFYNLHWLIRINGNVLSRVVRLEQIIRNALYEAYINIQ